MSEIRNLDGKLVCRIDHVSGTLEIKVKDCITLIKVNPDGTTEVVNRKNCNLSGGGASAIIKEKFDRNWV
jgi:hypothetical protein